MKCPVCSNPNPETSRFCSACGAPLVEASAEPTQELRPDEPRTPPGVDAPHRRFAPGVILASRYRIIECVGRGGMGEVYRADDLALDQPVALKFLPRALSRNARALRRFRNEVSTARQISHPNVCRVYDIGEAEGLHFLSMEYIQGENLQSLLRRIGRFPADRAVDIASELASGLVAAHDKGVLHRDLKPANVMIDERGRARITDFGLAAAAGTIENRDIRSGTPAYMAPEQWAGEGVTVKSDIYSLGLVLYEIFTGRPAFEDASGKEVVPASSVVSDLDPTVEKVILRCLSKEPANRPASATALRAALPTRDQLAAAIARGETPAPALVADAGDYSGLSPPIAWACLIAVVVSLMGNVWMSETARFVSIVRFPKSPDVLISDAREILQILGYPTPQRDSTFGFTRETGYIDELMKAERTQNWWDLLERGDPSLIRFWYRESPHYLVPHRITEFFPAEHDPPLTVPGMVSLELDTRGRLRRLEAAPPAQGDGELDGADVDWTSLFATSGFEPDDFEATESAWLPPTYADRRVAWRGVYPDAPEIPIRMEAASYKGRVVFFEIVEPWSEPSDPSAWLTASDVVPSEWARIAHVALHLLFIVTLALLARRNLKLGRGDRKLAFRLATVLGGMMSLHWLLAAHHVPDRAELEIFFGGLYRSFFVFTLGGLMYLALEPYARKLWPRALVSWVRLLDGRYRDPIVGRDVLVGCVQGIVIGLVSKASFFAPLWLGGVPPRPDAPQHPAELIALRGPREALAKLIQVQVNIATHVLFLFVALLLLRLILRKTWIAVAVHWTLYVLIYGQGFGYVAMAIAITAWHFVFFRFGWLPILVSTVCADALFGFPLTTDLGAPYAHATILLSAFCLGLAVYGFKVSLAGQPAFKDVLAET